jgi:hypothetical protein
MTKLVSRLLEQTRTMPLRLVAAVALRTAVLTAVGYLLGGRGGALIAALAAIIAAYKPRLVALYALIGLILTSVLTIIESPLGGGGAVSSFVSQRPVAGIVGRLTGIVFLVAVVCLWTDERAIRRPARAQSRAVPWRFRLRNGWTKRFAPITVFSLGVALVLNLAGDRSLRLVTIPLAAVVVAAAGLAWREHRRAGVASPIRSRTD